MIHYSNIPKSSRHYRFPFTKKEYVNCIQKVTLNGEDVTYGCYGLLSIFGFGYVDCYVVGEEDRLFKMENGEVAREPRQYGRIRITYSE